jgi:RimJ/RimL family protein N-acetyltransferase
MSRPIRGGFSSFMALSSLTTSRLRLVPWSLEAHTAALEAVNADPQAVEFLNAGMPYTPAETRAQSERFAAHWLEFGFGLWAVTVLEHVLEDAAGGDGAAREAGAGEPSATASERSSVSLPFDSGGGVDSAAVSLPLDRGGGVDSTAIGCVGLAHPLWFPEFADQVEVGWRFHPSAWGRGYATEAAEAAIAVARDALALERLIALIDPGNVRSIAVARRLGMTVEQTLPHPQRPGVLDVYALWLAA